MDDAQLLMLQKQYMKKFILLVWMFFLGLGLHAQLPQKPQDVSPLLVSEKIPAVSLFDPSGNTVDLTALLKEKPSILLFYRGGWCPYCTRQLADVATVQQDLEQMGYQVIAISPDRPEKFEATGKKASGSIRLLSDGNGELSRAMGIAFAAPANYEKILKDNADPAFLPVPAVFIVNEEGTILFEYINPDYKVRMPAALLKMNAAYFAEKK